jgi:hypothetical protein
MEDLYKFTLSAEPTDTGVLDRQNLEFAVQGMPPEGVFGVSPSVVVQAAIGLLVLLFASAFLSRRK